MPKLCQVLAIEKGIKQKVNSEGSTLLKISVKPALFNGFDKKYRPKTEEDEMFPPESQKVQYTSAELIKKQFALFAELWDVEATKDVANCSAYASVVVDGKTVIEHVPATFLLFMEKQLDDLCTTLARVPTLSQDEDWEKDANSALYRTGMVSTAKTKKILKPIVLYPATPEHPAQTQLISEDVLVGNWEKVLLSGAMPAPDRAKIYHRAEKLRQAVKVAREEANSVSAPDVDVSTSIQNYLLGG